MKIRVRHNECGREILVQQILESQGHCPWDGKAFNKDYTAVLAEALGQAEQAGGVLEGALEKIAGMDPDFTIDRTALTEYIDDQIDRLNASRGARGSNRAEAARRR